MNVMGWVISGVMLSGAVALALLGPAASGSQRGGNSGSGSALERQGETACADGDLDGCVEQGLSLLAKGEARASALLRDACDKGKARACGALATAYETGQGVKADKALATTLHQRACELGTAESCTTLGWMVSFDSDLGPADGARALGLFAQGCRGGDLLACRREAQAHECGRAVPADLERAVGLFHAACGKGDAASCEWLAGRLSDGTGGVERFANEPGFQPIQLQAAIEAARFGNRTRAVELLDRVERSAPDLKPQVAFARACLAFDAGDLAGAEVLLIGLPDAPGLRVLRRLIEKRRGGAESWSTALVSAWVDEGRPDLRTSRFLPSGRALEGDLGQCSSPRLRPRPPAVKDPATAFLLEFSDTVARSAAFPVSDALVDRALALAKDARSEVRMVALTVLTQPSLTEAQRRKLQPEVAKHLSRLAREHPKSLFFQLKEVMGLSKEGPALTAELVNRLEGLADLPFDPPLHEVYAAFRAAHATAGEGPVSAFNATLSVFIAPEALILTNWDEKARDVDPALRRRLGRVLLRLGGDIADGPWLIHAFQGAALMKRGAALMEGPEAADAAMAIRARARRYYQGVGTMRAMGSWPLPSLSEDWLKRVSTEEMTFYSELSERGAW